MKIDLQISIHVDICTNICFAVVASISMWRHTRHMENPAEWGANCQAITCKKNYNMQKEIYLNWNIVALYVYFKGGRAERIIINVCNLCNNSNGTDSAVTIS